VEVRPRRILHSRGVSLVGQENGNISPFGASARYHSIAAKSKSEKLNLGGISMGGAFSGLISIVILVVTIFPLVKIIQKAGYSGWWVLLGLIPLVNFIMIWIFALSDWPALRKT
jgi:uncharacterized membrane protein YhaH (DUF805 family)